METSPPWAVISSPESTGTGGRGDRERAVQVTASASTSRSTENLTVALSFFRARGAGYEGIGSGASLPELDAEDSWNSTGRAAGHGWISALPAGSRVREVRCRG